MSIDPNLIVRAGTIAPPRDSSSAAGTARSRYSAYAASTAPAATRPSSERSTAALDAASSRITSTKRARAMVLDSLAMRAAASAVPFFTALGFGSPGIPVRGLSLTTKASGARDQATSSAAACLQNGRVRAAKHVQLPLIADEVSLTYEVSE